MTTIDPLADNDPDGNPDEVKYVFHTTSYASAQAIAVDGLLPRTGGGVYQHGGYDIHSRGKIFASEGGAALQWFGKIEEMLGYHDSEYSDLDERIDAMVPVMLRIDLDNVAELPNLDEIGSRDVIGGTSFYFTKPIPAYAIEFWHPRKQEWVSLEDTDLPDARLGVESIEYYDDEGGEVDEDEWDGESPPGITVFGPYNRGGFKPPGG